MTTPFPPSSTLRQRFVSYALGAYKVLIERVVVYTSEGAHWIGNQKFIVKVFKSQSDQRVATPPPHKHVVFPKCMSIRNFEIAILFKIVQRSYNKAFEVDTNHQSMGARVVICGPGYLRFLWKGWLYKL